MGLESVRAILYHSPKHHFSLLVKECLIPDLHVLSSLPNHKQCSISEAALCIQS